MLGACACWPAGGRGIIGGWCWAAPEECGRGGGGGGDPRGRGPAGGGRGPPARWGGRSGSAAAASSTCQIASEHASVRARDLVGLRKCLDVVPAADQPSDRGHWGALS